MKSSTSLSRFAAVSAVFLTVSLTTACGQTGDLYLPKIPPAEAPAPKPASNTPQQGENQATPASR